MIASNLFLLLLLVHLLGDWIVQTDYQAANKTSLWRVMHRHCISYHIPMVMILLPFIAILDIVIIVVVSYATHAIIDRRWPVQVIIRKTGSSLFAEKTWGILVVDQSLHIIILLILSIIFGVM